jgi:hypothetical protein
VTVALVAVPALSTSASGVLRSAPIALFQFGCETTPAVSLDAIGVGLFPTKLMPIDAPAVGAAVTASVTVAVRVSDPLVPLIVSVDVPVGVLAEVVTLSVELPDPLTDAGLNEVVVPAGAPVTEKVTVPLNPFNGLTLAV